MYYLLVSISLNHRRKINSGFVKHARTHVQCKKYIEVSPLLMYVIFVKLPISSRMKWKHHVYAKTDKFMFLRKKSQNRG